MPSILEKHWIKEGLVAIHVALFNERMYLNIIGTLPTRTRVDVETVLLLIEAQFSQTRYLVG